MKEEVQANLSRRSVIMEVRQVKQLHAMEPFGQQADPQIHSSDGEVPL